MFHHVLLTISFARPCDGAWSIAPWCQPGPPFAPRAAALVANLTAREKSQLLLMIDGGVERLSIDPYIWWSEALHGAIAPFQHPNAKPATCWPEPIGVGSSFNASLFAALGTLTSTEGRGLQGGVGNTYWAPNVNIMRDPRWGRGQECPGEDPTLSSTYAEHFVSGMQGSSDATYLKVSSALKHFAAYSQETGRVNDPVIVVQRDMDDTYLPAFEVGVKRGKASGLMCSYNAETFGYINLNKSSGEGAAPYAGVPSCANKGLLHDLARTKWGFDGYITTDCGAADYVGGFLESNGYPSSAADTVFAVLGAGVDTDCGGAGTPRWSNATLLGLLTNASTVARIKPLVDASLRRLFTLRMRLGHFDPPSATPWGEYGLEKVDTPAHRALAMDAALQGFVLLQNNNINSRSKSKAGLPLDPKAMIAVLGPNCMQTGWSLGNYHERQAPTGVVISPCLGLQQVAERAGGNATCVEPAECSIGGNASCFTSDSAAAIAASDAVVLFVGLDGTQEAEGRDKTSLTLPGTQLAMVEAATKQAKKKKMPVIVVVMGGSAVDLTSLKANTAIDAIVWVGYPGQASGAAIASALFGAVNRWGKSPFTWYNDGFCDVANLSDYRMRPNGSYPGRTHRFYTGTPVFAFGTGLSLTTFERTVVWEGGGGGGAPARVVVARSSDDDDAERVVATLNISVANTGDREGDEIVMVYVVPPRGAIALGAPRQQLAAFVRVTLAAGVSTHVSLGITQRHLVVAAPQRESSDGGESGMWHVRINADEATALPFTVQFE
jgi:beta-glucosidase-like glycosyl hydrolase